MSDGIPAHLKQSFLPSVAPLWGGRRIGVVRHEGWSAEIVQRGDRDFSVAARAGDLSYVIRGIADEAAAEEIAAAVPMPNVRNSHVYLKVVDRDAAGWIVRVVNGEGLGDVSWRSGDRPCLSDHHRLATFGSENPLPRHAVDLTFSAVVFLEKPGLERVRAEAAGEIRSLWVRDASDVFEKDECVYRFVGRRARNGGVLTEEEMHGVPGGADGVMRGEEMPLERPVKEICRRDLSPDPAANYRYVAERDPDRRSVIRRELLDAASARALSELGTVMEGADPELTIADFIATGGEWQVAHDSPYARTAPPMQIEGRASAVVYGWGDRAAGEDFAVYREHYRNDEGAHASRYHVHLEDHGWVVVADRRVAAALLYAAAKASGDDRVPGRRLPSLTLDEFKSGGVYHGYGFVSFGADDDLRFMVRRTKAGYVCDFCDIPASSTLEGCVEDLYGRLADMGVLAEKADLDPEASPRP